MIVGGLPVFPLSKNASRHLQIGLACFVVVLLMFYLFGSPGRALPTLWRNHIEARNAATILGVLLVPTVWIYFKNDLVPQIAVVTAALIVMAGPLATIWALVVGFAVVSAGFQLIGQQTTARLAQTPAGRLLLAFWVGKAIYVLALICLNSFPLNGRLLFGLLPCILIVASPRGCADAYRHIMSCLNLEGITTQRSATARLARCFFVLSVLLLIVAAVHPGFDGDAMTMHMRIAREILNKGRWDYNVFDYSFAVMPLGPQFNFSAMYVVGGVEAVKTDLVLQLLAALGLVITGGGFRPRTAGFAIASGLCFMPMFVHEISGLFIETTLSGFVVASAVLLVSAIRRQSVEMVLLAGLCAAGAAAAKPFGLCLAPAILWGLFVCRRNLMVAPSRGRLAAILCLALVLSTFFYLNAWIRTGNPVLPFYNGVFKSAFWGPENFIDRRWSDHWSWIMPWRMTFTSSLYGEAANGSMGLIPMFLVGCSVGYLAMTRKNIVATIPLAVAALYLIGSCIEVQYIRYMLPGILLVAMTMSYYVDAYIRDMAPAPWLAIMSALLAANLFGLPASRFRNGLMHIPAKNMIFPGHYRGLYSKGYFEEMIDGHRYLGSWLDATQRRIPVVLMLGCPYGAHFNGTTIYTSWHNYSWTQKASRLLEPGEFDRFLKEKAVTHVTIDGCTSGLQAELAQSIKARFPQVAEFVGVELYEVK